MDPSLHIRAQGRLLPAGELIPPLHQEQRGYALRFARTEEELDSACRLRFEVFNLELGEGLAESYGTGRDRDEFDAQCQHLIVEQVATGEVVGTYRLQVSDSALAGMGFYSASEFELERMPQEVLRDAVELGRACIARHHRSRNVLYLLWRGLAAYMLWTRRRYFFGCSSLTSQDPALGWATYRQLERAGSVHPSIRVPARADHGIGPEPAEAPGATGAPGRAVEIPTLFGIYLRYGARVLGPPAIDRVFGTIDFLTLLDVGELDPRTFEAFAR